MVFNTALVLNIVFSLIVLIAVYKLFGFFQSLVSKKKNLWYRSLVVRNNEILNVDNIELMFRSVLFYAKWIVLFFLLYLAVPLIFAEVPETREWSLSLLDLVKETFVNIGISWVNYIPNLITIAVIVKLTEYVVPKFNISVTFTTRSAIGRTAAVLFATVKINFRTRTART